MSFKSLKELKDIQRKAAEAKAAGDRPKAEWITSRLKNDRDSVKFRFLQELDEDAGGFDESKGVGLIVMEHDTPWGSDKMAHARCTMEDEGQCFRCEKANSGEKLAYQWKAKPKVYVNVTVLPQSEDESPSTMIFSWKANSDVVRFLLEHAEEYDSITNMPFKLTRNGKGKETTYTIMPVMSEKLLGYLPLDGQELYELDKYVISVPYDKQAAFYGGAPKEEAPPAMATSRPSATDADEW